MRWQEVALQGVTIGLALLIALLIFAIVNKYVFKGELSLVSPARQPKSEPKE